MAGKKEDYGAEHWSSDKAWECRMPNICESLVELAVNRILQVLDEQHLTQREKNVALARATRRLMSLE